MAASVSPATYRTKGLQFHWPSGSVSGASTVTVPVTVDPTILAAGWTTGTVVISSNGGNASLEVRVYIGDVRYTYFPFVARR